MGGMPIGGMPIGRMPMGPAIMPIIVPICAGFIPEDMAWAMGQSSRGGPYAVREGSGQGEHRWNRASSDLLGAPRSSLEILGAIGSSL
eukprot:5971870-Alexandrium_andersonii.AAC.1